MVFLCVKCVPQGVEMRHVQPGLQQVTRLVVGIARVQNHRALFGDVTAELGRQFDHAWRERADGSDEGIGPRGGA